MIRLPTTALASLRNRLRERGARPSLALPVPAVDPLEAAIPDEYGPLAEAMYLLMAADQKITGAERDVIRGALRELDDRIRSRHVEAMLGAAADALLRDGWEARLAAVASAIGDDPTRAEAAILLAAAVAYADGEIAPEENQVMGALMEALGVSAARTAELVASLERVDEVLQNDARVDAADVAIDAALRLRTPEDFERLAATTDRPDVTLVLRLYAVFVRGGDELLDQTTVPPRSIPTARVEALRTLAASLTPERSARLDELRAALSALAEALARVDAAADLRTLSSGGGPLAATQEALGRLSRTAARGLERLGRSAVVAEHNDQLLVAFDDRARDRDGARDRLDQALSAFVARHEATIPSAVLTSVDLVLRAAAQLPLFAEAGKDARALPGWIPASRVVGGFYVHGALGDGGSGSVFAVSRFGEHEDPAAERFALKVPLYDAVAARSVSEAEYLRVFRKEAGALLELPEHPHLSGFVTFDARARPKPLLVMELVEGVDCKVLLERRELSVSRVLSVLDGVLAGLAAMHEVGLAHLDVKPSNVVLRPNGEAVLVDFGLAGRELRPGCATPPYAAPEVWGHLEDGEPPKPFAADLYAFACVAYELLVGKPLFFEEHVLALLGAHLGHDGEPPGIDALARQPATAALAKVLAGCLRKSPRGRPTAGEVRGSLRALAPALSALDWPLLGYPPVA
ncbi:MAG: serine/threonine protein kinase [Myxococcales bacterium]|nr:serine/threonine protein kinase [Myxococcales bacterium]